MVENGKRSKETLRRAISSLVLGTGVAGGHRVLTSFFMVDHQKHFCRKKKVCAVSHRGWDEKLVGWNNAWAWFPFKGLLDQVIGTWQ